MRLRDALFAAPVGDHQRFVAEHVYDSRYAVAGLANLSDRGICESQVGTAVGNGYAMENLAGGRGERHRRQRAGKADALIELPQCWLCKPQIELGLTHDDDLQEFELLGFEVGQEP